ncbi:hypothetical protein ACOME3_009521 [Neoechinorhynchus agilis]
MVMSRISVALRVPCGTPYEDNIFTCPICFELMKQPIQTSCGHRFCRECYERSNSDRNFRTRRCPLDNTNTYKVFNDVAFEREIKSLLVNCIADEDCKWKGEYRELENHTKSCPMMVIKCTNDACNERIRRSDLGNHLVVCKFRRVPCQFCAIQVNHSRMTVRILCFPD